LRRAQAKWGGLIVVVVVVALITKHVDCVLLS
jgi:hypothetical protein